MSRCLLLAFGRSGEEWGAAQALGGLLLGVAGLFLPQLLGIGYGTIESIVGG
jgi:H+/Cl- antiporter ClcA